MTMREADECLSVCSDTPAIPSPRTTRRNLAVSRFSTRRRGVKEEPQACFQTAGR